MRKSVTHVRLLRFGSKCSGVLGWKNNQGAKSYFKKIFLNIFLKKFSRGGNIKKYKLKMSNP